MSNLTFTNEELEHYITLREKADSYLNHIIKMKRLEEFEGFMKENSN